MWLCFPSQEEKPDQAGDWVGLAGGPGGGGSAKGC